MRGEGQGVANLAQLHAWTGDVRDKESCCPTAQPASTCTVLLRHGPRGRHRTTRGSMRSSRASSRVDQMLSESRAPLPSTPERLQPDAGGGGHGARGCANMRYAPLATEQGGSMQHWRLTETSNTLSQYEGVGPCLPTQTLPASVAQLTQHTLGTRGRGG
jgi:hypothetical protein